MLEREIQIRKDYQSYLCIEQSELFIRGSFQSNKASLLDIRLERCRDRPDCKSDAEITAYFRGTYILMYYNQIRFDSRKYFEESVVLESSVEWIKVNSQIQTVQPFKVSKTQLLLQDHRFFDLDSLTELEDASIFKLESMPSISFEENDFVIQGITIEMNLDLVVIARSGYTVLDYLSDVGGI